MKYLKIHLSNVTLEKIIMIFNLLIRNKLENRRKIQEICNLLNYLKFQNKILLNQLKIKNLNVSNNYLNEYYKLLNEIFKKIFIIEKNIHLNNQKILFCRINYQIKNIHSILKRKINKFISKFSMIININEFKNNILNSNLNTLPFVFRSNFFNIE